MKIAVDEFDGKVVYGAKRKDTGSGMIVASTTYNVKIFSFHTFRQTQSIFSCMNHNLISGYVGHADQLAPTLKELTRLEKESQNLFLHRFYNTQMPV